MLEEFNFLNLSINWSQTCFTIYGLPILQMPEGKIIIINNTSCENSASLIKVDSKWYSAHLNTFWREGELPLLIVIEAKN